MRTRSLRSGTCTSSGLNDPRAGVKVAGGSDVASQAMPEWGCTASLVAGARAPGAKPPSLAKPTKAHTDKKTTLLRVRLCDAELALETDGRSLRSLLVEGWRTVGDVYPLLEPDAGGPYSGVRGAECDHRARASRPRLFMASIVVLDELAAERSERNDSSISGGTCKSCSAMDGVMLSGSPDG